MKPINKMTDQELYNEFDNHLAQMMVIPEITTQVEELLSKEEYSFIPSAEALTVINKHPSPGQVRQFLQVLEAAKGADLNFVLVEIEKMFYVYATKKIVPRKVEVELCERLDPYTSFHCKYEESSSSSFGDS